MGPRKSFVFSCLIPLVCTTFADKTTQSLHERFLRYGWRHKYFWAIAIFVAVVGFLDPNSFWNRRLHKERISELKADISRYQRMYTEDTRRLRELQNNPDAIKKIAREKYFMKTADEDVFVIRENQTNDETAR